MPADRQPPTPVLFTGGGVADARREARTEEDVLVVDGRIAAVGPAGSLRDRAPAGTAEFPLDGRTVLPGLVNMHTHFTLVLPGDRGREIAAMDAHDLALHVADGARRTLLSGVTTVRCVAEEDGVDFALRRAVDAGRVPGPRVFTAGRGLVCTGGHGHENSSTLECDGPDGFRYGVRSQVRAGADLIKVMISGGIAGQHEAIDTRQLTRDEIAAVIGAAHDAGRKVTAHAGPAPVVADAVELGLDCVEHGYQLTPEVCAQMAAAGCALVPTLGVTRCGEFFDECGVPRWMQERSLGAADRHTESFRTALRAGVEVMLGSDLPPFWAIDDTNATAWEYGLMADLGAPAGFSPRDALAAATSTPLRWLGADDRLGAVAEGFLADLLVVDGDPLSDTTAVRRVHAVLSRGEVVRDDERSLAA
ncbi:amidohydrolase family protein [Kineococcus sp. SYSU DK003]|uniref:amidohydrolase family protein n=1 Tax=Kineococcus sp. SYSU DK003 TaxID=3383124 RepID=UPI003D7EB468